MNITTHALHLTGLNTRLNKERAYQSMVRQAACFLARLLMVLTMLMVANSYAQTLAPGSCSLIPNSKTCADTTPCKVDSTGHTICLADAVNKPAGALSVPQTCWRYDYRFSCADPAKSVNTCTANNNWYKADKCKIVKSNCQGYARRDDGTLGACLGFNNTYSCETRPVQMGLSNTCINQSLGFSPKTNHPPVTNNSTARAIVMLEVANQISTYTKAGLKTAFAGTPESCSMGYFGVKNCCVSAPGAQSNSQIVGLATGNAMGVVKYAGQQAIDAASPYVFDAMYASGLYTEGLNTALTTSSNVTSAVVQTIQNGTDAASAVTQATGTTFASGGLSFGAFGFTYGTGAFSSGWGAMQIGGQGTEYLIAMDSGYLSFNPYVLGAQVAIMVVTNLMKCSQEEQVLAMHKGANLAIQTKEECVNKVPLTGVCLEYKRSYCAFNGLLAKLINQQGKAQLGLDFSDCKGLTLDQLADLDFSRINLDEFAQQMSSKAQAALPNTTTLPQGYQSTVQSGGSKNFSPQRR